MLQKAHVCHCHNIINCKKLGKHGLIQPFTMADVKDKFSLSLCTKILSTPVIKPFRIPVAKFTICDKSYVLKNEVSRLFW